MYLATAIRADDRQFSTLNYTLHDCARILDAPEIPELYVIQGPYANAYTIGMDRPFIVLTSGLLDLMSEQELRFIVGHELGHALSGHAVYRTMLLHLMRLAGNLGWMPIGGWALRAIVAALMEWQRKSELSGDRAGMLCGQDVDTAIRVEMKLAGVPGWTRWIPSASWHKQQNTSAPVICVTVCSSCSISNCSRIRSR